MDIELKDENLDAAYSFSSEKFKALIDFEITEKLTNEVAENDLNFVPKQETKNEDDISTSFDAFSDENNQIYKRYNLRKTIHDNSQSINQSEKTFSSEDLYEPSINRKGKKKKTGHKSVSDSKEYQCHLCPSVFQFKTGLTLHMSKHISENKFTCLLCQETFESNEELLDHKICHRSAEECYICKKCKVAFSKHSTYINHSFRHMKPPYQCPECLVTSNYIKTIQSHIHIHFETKEPCKICQKHVPKRIMTSHLNQHKTSIKCVECGKIFTRKSYYAYHMCSHTGVKPYQCLYCGRGFASLSQKTMHTKLHTGEKSFDCQICFQSFIQSSTRDKHEQTHNRVKQFECNLCEKKFKNKEYLKYHMRLHNNDKPYKCPDCPKSFVTSTHLVLHTSAVHLKAKFACVLCNKKFNYKKSLHRHNLSNSHQKIAYKLKVTSNHENND